MEEPPKNKGGRTESLKWLSFGDKIVRLMRERGITSPVLVEKSKVPTKVLQHARKKGSEVSYEHLQQIAIGLKVEVEDIGKPIPEPTLTPASVLKAANEILSENKDVAEVLAGLTNVREDDQIAKFILLNKNPLEKYYDLIFLHLDPEKSAKLSVNARHGLRAFKDLATMLTLPLEDLEAVQSALERECVRVVAKTNEKFVNYLIIARVIAEKVPKAARSFSIQSLANDDCSLSITDRSYQWLIPVIVDIPQPADAGEFNGFIGPFTKGLARLFPIPTTTADPEKEINRRLGDYRGKQRFVAAILDHNQQAAIETIHTTFPHLIVIVLPEFDEEPYTKIFGWRQGIEARIHNA